mmetsp:Transcript_15398/g.58232  ORF Transcript_15398/g.58232 Transcript_15398/m.58232 type:complete len:234 (-) Transcript_15398:540-1241(-)
MGLPSSATTSGWALANARASFMALRSAASKFGVGRVPRSPMRPSKPLRGARPALDPLAEPVVCKSDAANASEPLPTCSAKRSADAASSSSRPAEPRRCGSACIARRSSCWRAVAASALALRTHASTASAASAGGRPTMAAWMRAAWRASLSAVIWRKDSAQDGLASASGANSAPAVSPAVLRSAWLAAPAPASELDLAPAPGAAASAAAAPVCTNPRALRARPARLVFGQVTG